jgi:hypothetical protein
MKGKLTKKLKVINFSTSSLYAKQVKMYRVIAEAIIIYDLTPLVLTSVLIIADAIKMVTHL